MSAKDTGATGLAPATERIDMQGGAETLPIPHAHHCPSCYEKVECRQVCSGLDPMGSTPGGLLLGSPAECDDCRPLDRCPHTPDGKLPDDEMGECEDCAGTAYCRGDIDKPPADLVRANPPAPTSAPAMDAKASYWWCDNCRKEVDGGRVTFAEMHEDCGHPVRGIDPVPLVDPVVLELRAKLDERMHAATLLLDERDAAIRERDELRAQCDALLAACERAYEEMRDTAEDDHPCGCNGTAPLCTFCVIRDAIAKARGA